jgi:S-adenosylmethionine:tRNA ribosyltransferase-isomerase
MTFDDPTDDAWSFKLPESCIARYPPAIRGDSRLLHLPLAERNAEDLRFDDLVGLLGRGDRLVINDTRVLAARLAARRTTGGRVELLLLDPGPGEVRALAKPAKKLRIGERLELVAGGFGEITGASDGGVVRVRFDRPPLEIMEEQGRLPIPPYLGRDEEPIDRDRYQTVYAAQPGSAAAPTAGLHFTPELFAALEAQGVAVSRVTLHVGLGTFLPLRPENITSGRLHIERYIVSDTAAAELAQTRRDGGRVIAVGTTSARTLEAATPPGARSPEAGSGETDLFIRPPYSFRAIDGLITNFHLPGSSLVMLVAALVGRERLLDAYRGAVSRGYRFFSYGDAMLLL